MMRWVALAAVGLLASAGARADVVTPFTYTIGAPPPTTCPRGTVYSDGCAGAQASGSVQHTNLFTTYTGTNFSAHRPPWNVAGVDYPVGYSGALADAATATLPSCASRTGSGSGPFAITIAIAGCTLSHLDFSPHGGICVTVTASGTTTFDNDKFGVGTNCPQSVGGAISINTTGTVNIKYSQIDGTPSTAKYQGLIQINTAGATLNVTYSAFTNNGQADIQSQAASTIVSRYNYAEGLGTGGLAHGDYVIGNMGSGTASQDMSWNVIYAGPNSTSTTDCYIASQAGSSVHMTSYCNNNVLLGPPDVSNGFLVHFSLDGTGVVTQVNNNYMGLLHSYGFFTSDGSASGTGTRQCNGNVDMATGATAIGPISGITCN